MTTHSTSIRNSLANLVVDALDDGTTNASGRLIFLTDGDVVTATLQFFLPAFSDADTGIAIADTITPELNVIAGAETTKWNAVDRDETVVFSGTYSDFNGTGDLQGQDAVLSGLVGINTMSYEAAQ